MTRAGAPPSSSVLSLFLDDEPRTPREADDVRRAREADARARAAIQWQRERAERLLNVVRIGVLVLLAGAAVVYAPFIPARVRLVNWLVLGPILVWTVLQFGLGSRDGRAPAWLTLANPLVDITAVTAILAGYGITQSGALALKSPIFLAYFAILAARPITSSTRKAALAAALVVVEYGALVVYLMTGGRTPIAPDPVTASFSPGVAVLDEGARLLLLIVAGAVATYATAWHERLVRSYYVESADRERLEVELARAQLETLKLQLSPHFLFNTLNNISALISLDPRLAERMLGGLSDFLRLSLHNSGAQEVPLERELQMLERYLLIQQIRFAERLQVRAERKDGALVLRVSDDGVGRDVGAPAFTQAPAGTGIGLGNTRARLARLYGEKHRFDVASEPGRGFAVTVEIPFHTTPIGVAS